MTDRALAPSGSASQRSTTRFVSRSPAGRHAPNRVSVPTMTSDAPRAISPRKEFQEAGMMRAIPRHLPTRGLESRSPQRALPARAPDNGLGEARGEKVAHRRILGPDGQGRAVRTPLARMPRSRGNRRGRAIRSCRLVSFWMEKPARSGAQFFAPHRDYYRNGIPNQDSLDRAVSRQLAVPEHCKSNQWARAATRRRQIQRRRAEKSSRSLSVSPTGRAPRGKSTNREQALPTP